MNHKHLLTTDTYNMSKVFAVDIYEKANYGVVKQRLIIKLKVKFSLKRKNRKDGLPKKGF